MLKLESLELVGFKSFADKTKVVFPAKITGIVGPNGCGKSNLSDAIGFVLGTHTAKSLRGQTMDDFIFGGTGKRKQSGLAEVRLRLRKTSGEPLVINGTQLDEDELEISRRVYRDGESQYLVNQKRCRLMDIQKILDEAGLGFSGYAMIAQGRIESFLTARPLDRRALIEEAAQITGYKAKRRNAEMKLDLAKQNLLRINDIIVEVERQLRSLKRQANKTQRYKKLKAEFRTLQALRFASESMRLNEELERLVSRQSQIRSEIEQLNSLLSEGEKNYQENNQRRDALETDLRDQQEREAELRLELDRTDNSTRYHLEQIDQTRDNLNSLSSERETLNLSIAQLNEEWEQGQTDNTVLKEDELEIETELKACGATVLEKSQTLRLKEEHLEELTGRLMRVSAEIASLRNAKEQTTQRTRRIEGEKQKVRDDRGLIAGKLTEIRASLEQKEKGLHELSESISSLRLSQEELKQRRAGLIEDLEGLSSQTTDLRNRLVALNERLQSLQELELSRSHYSEGVQKVLSHLTKNGEVRATGTLADSIETSERFERLVEEFLDEELEYILVDSLEEAVAGVSEIKSLKTGKCTFFSVHSSNGFGKVRPSAIDRSSLPDEAQGVFGTLSDVIQMQPEMQQAFARILPQQADSIVVSDMGRAMQLAHSYPESTFITLDGESLTPRGLVSATAAQARKIGLLSLKRQKRELEKKVAAQRKALAESESRLALKKEELTEVNAALETGQSELYQLEKQLIGKRHEFEQATADLDRQERTVRTFDFELERLEEESVELLEKLKLTSESVIQLESDRQEIETGLRSGREALHDLREELDEAQRVLNGVSARKQVLEERTLALTRTLERIRSQQQEANSRLQSMDLRETQGKERLEHLSEQVILLKETAKNLRVESQQTGEKLTEARRQFEECKQQVKKAEQALTDLRGKGSTLQEQRSAVDVENARIETQVQHLQQQCLEQLHISLEETVSRVDLSQYDLEEVLSNYERLKNRLESFGPINMTALKEYEENEERYEFLTKQKTDIEQSIADTTKAIQEINRRSRAKFTAAFEAVNENFKVVFGKLFNGGDCGIELLDEDDILESGIDIYAQPPGKRLQNVMLLSGGEKALTVFALLIGIFMYRPSRFCVLDEVDAPLDDANVRRFGALIEEMSADTQFIIVTHNKRTMEIAETLYGVTMQEPGVSKVVSAQF
ncbi:MAG: chromosome segregation protein SMC [Acidobacteriota bacterium]|nr:MAG: chromosome segregation protein SMC [Acidobacteriota bacterium]